MNLTIQKSVADGGLRLVVRNMQGVECTFYANVESIAIHVARHEVHYELETHGDEHIITMTPRPPRTP